MRTLPLFFVFWLLAIQISQAQSVDLIQNPPNMKWRQINSDHFKLIFPETYEKEAGKVMTGLEAMYLPNSKNLGILPKKIPIIIQTQNTEANAFVEPTFFRSEFFLTPPQSSFGGTTEWMQTLAVHEGRHIVQMNKQREGGTKIFHRILGGLAGNMIIMSSLWFAEGDAVGTETALTQSGRGRVPEFDVNLRTQLLTKNPIPFATMVNGSFKRNIPNRYVHGYYLTSYIKNNYGADAYDKILNRTYSFKNTFRGATSKITGKSIPELYALAMNEATEKWTAQQKNIEETKADLQKHRKTDYYTSYWYPQSLPDGRILAVRQGLGDVAQLVVFDKEGQANEKVLHTLGE
ncbi:MAG: hypothetical protein RLZZ292_2219, partial [Bacteroidota bacterium]